MTARIFHDPQARLDYGWDWTLWLQTGETITSHTVTATNVTVESSAVVGSQTVAWVSGGTKGKATLTFHIVTDAGREDDRTLSLYVADR